MLSVTIPRLATHIDRLRGEGGSGTTILLVNPEQFAAAKAFVEVRSDRATGDWRIEVGDVDPKDFQGEHRRKFEDAIFERDRAPASVRIVYVTTMPFYIIPSVKDRVSWLDLRGRHIPHSQAKAPRRATGRRPEPTDTLWHQDHQGGRA